MRKLGWMVGSAAAAVGAVAMLTVGSRPAEAVAGEVFLLTGTAKFWHFHGPTQAGTKAFVNTAKGDAIASSIRNDDPRPGHNAGGLLESDPDGKAFIRFDSLTQWSISIDQAFAENVLTLDGFVDGTGAFMMHGYHTKSDSRFVATGKVKFKRGTLTPTGMSGKVQGVSKASQHYCTGTFKTVGRALTQ